MLAVENRPSSAVTAVPRETDPLAPTIFHEHWWLHAATGGYYEQVEISHGHRVVGRFPYTSWQVPGRRFSGLPTLTHVLGPAIYEGTGSPNTRFLQRYSVTRELISKLPKFYRFRQKLHAGLQEAIAFQAEGFLTSVQFNFEIEAQSELEIWQRLRNKTRNVIRRAQEDLAVSELHDVDEFIHLYDQNLVARGREKLAPRNEFAAVCGEALQRQAGSIFCARDARGRLAAAIFIAFDRKRAYYLMSTRSTGSGNGAISLLIWHALHLCAERGLAFDFDGIAHEGATLLYAGFGGKTTPRYIVMKDSKMSQFVHSCNGVLGRLAQENTFDMC